MLLRSAEIKPLFNRFVQFTLNSSPSSPISLESPVGGLLEGWQRTCVGSSSRAGRWILNGFHYGFP